MKKVYSINDPAHNDNRNYNYSNDFIEHRIEYSVIEKLISPNSKVVDLGCGSGTLLKNLIDTKNISAFGIDISSSAVDACKKKGIQATQSSIDITLPIEDNSFDFAICNATIQMVMYPEILLKEMKRVAGNLIISFPNFGFYKNRIDMMLKGSMPEYMLFGYKWFNTGHIHQLSLKDFEKLVREIGGLDIKSINWVETDNYLKNKITRSFPNLFMLFPIIHLTKH